MNVVRGSSKTAIHFCLMFLACKLQLDTGNVVVSLRLCVTL